MTASSREHAMHRIAAVTALAFSLAVIAACAPDSVRSVQATGFNGYIKQLPGSCKRLQIGTQDLTEQILNNEMGNDNYNYFLDQTSRLYYNRITPAAYREALTGFFGPGTGNQAAFDCILRTLPPDRPSSPS
jgi:hypothetical protein